MNQNHFKKRCPDSKFLKIIKLLNYKFVLDVNGLGSIIPFKDSYVEGVLYKISNEDMNVLDEFEGLNYNIYKKEFLDILINNSYSKVLVYISLNSNNSLIPYYNYMESIIKLAEDYNFSKEYIEYLKTFL